eukprot:COSAG01_NODE_146_length_24099_cov_25.341208_31_plen_34_part_00
MCLVLLLIEVRVLHIGVCGQPVERAVSIDLVPQ